MQKKGVSSFYWFFISLRYNWEECLSSMIRSEMPRDYTGRFLFLNYKFYCYYFPSSLRDMDSLWNTSTCLASDRSSYKILSYPRTLCSCHDYNSIYFSSTEKSSENHRIMATLDKVSLSVEEHTSRIYFCVITLNLRRICCSQFYMNDQTTAILRVHTVFWENTSKDQTLSKKIKHSRTFLLSVLFNIYC